MVDSVSTLASKSGASPSLGGVVILPNDSSTAESKTTCAVALAAHQMPLVTAHALAPRARRTGSMASSRAGLGRYFSKAGGL